MIIVRFAISIFALAMLGMALSLSGTPSPDIHLGAAIIAPVMQG